MEESTGVADESDEMVMIDFSEDTRRSSVASESSLLNSSPSKRALIGFEDSLDDEEQVGKHKLPRTSTPNSRFPLFGFDESCESSFEQRENSHHSTRSTNRRVQLYFESEEIADPAAFPLESEVDRNSLPADHEVEDSSFRQINKEASSAPNEQELQPDGEKGNLTLSYYLAIFTTSPCQ